MPNYEAKLSDDQGTVEITIAGEPDRVLIVPMATIRALAESPDRQIIELVVMDYQDGQLTNNKSSP